MLRFLVGVATGFPIGLYLLGMDGIACFFIWLGCVVVAAIINEVFNPAHKESKAQ